MMNAFSWTLFIYFRMLTCSLNFSRLFCVSYAFDFSLLTPKKKGKKIIDLRDSSVRGDN